MIREGLKKHYIGLNKEFRYRGEEPGRLENFSDAVFALAITLLLISTSPPSNFEQIRRFVYELIPFLLCIAFIIVIWHEHYVFYFRYGLRNGKIIPLNTLFLSLVLFFVYPLKFLARLVLFPIASIFQDNDLLNSLNGMITPQDIGDLMIIYGIGAASVFFVLMLMYRYALKQAIELDLNELEKFDTQTKIRTNLLMGMIPVVSVLLAFIFRSSWLAGPIAGFTYSLYPLVMTIHGKKVDRQRKNLIESEVEKTAPNNLI
jgi:uncharacterized membrane protein